MKFTTRRDITFKLIFAAISLLLFILIAESFLFREFSESYVLVFDSIVGVIWMFIIWIYIDTSYYISDEYLVYRSGPIYGKISLKTIKKIIVDKTAWSGSKKVGLARHGLLIEYGLEKELYISPKTNTTFVDYIKTKNPNIKIEQYERYIVK
ncbi:PH domain-containing protein [Psychroflexus tropicus]|uniref:PH domain-containing protein n=1 Tax=Psychroflexus tropicus TaxID=197345 RepID=UPI000379664A|nr:PH domain-containing protein [Psychroflexus tropicus]